MFSRASTHRNSIASIAASLERPSVSETFNIAGPRDFRRSDCVQLYSDAPSVLRLRVPEAAEAFEQRGWTLPTQIDRIYDSSEAESSLGYLARDGPMQLLGNDPD